LAEQPQLPTDNFTPPSRTEFFWEGKLEGGGNAEVPADKPVAAVQQAPAMPAAAQAPEMPMVPAVPAPAQPAAQPVAQLPQLAPPPADVPAPANSQPPPNPMPATETEEFMTPTEKPGLDPQLVVQAPTDAQAQALELN
jgi:hypothetical protein